MPERRFVGIDGILRPDPHSETRIQPLVTQAALCVQTLHRVHVHLTEKFDPALQVWYRVNVALSPLEAAWGSYTDGTKDGKSRPRIVINSNGATNHEKWANDATATLIHEFHHYMQTQLLRDDTLDPRGYRLNQKWRMYMRRQTPYKMIDAYILRCQALQEVLAARNCDADTVKHLKETIAILTDVSAPKEWESRCYTAMVLSRAAADNNQIRGMMLQQYKTEGTIRIARKKQAQSVNLIPNSKALSRIETKFLRLARHLNWLKN